MSSPPPMTAVATIAGHSGKRSWKTMTRVQARAMKIAPKMYFSIVPSSVLLLDAIVQRCDAAVQRDLEPDEHRDGDGADPQRDPQERVALAGPHQRLVGRLAG